jgi:very-short-patch-repair endonuclease
MDPMLMRVVDALTRLGGVARTATLHARGISRHRVDAAVGAGLVTRVRQGWIALAQADRMLVAAARQGVVLTCVTQARRLGLWVHSETPAIHVGATPGSAVRKVSGVHAHWAKPLVPRHPDSLVDPIENVLAIVADCEPHEQALATWDSALNQGLVERASIGRLPLKTVARRILEEAWPFADAGLETYLRPRLRWLRLPLSFQAWIAGHRVDALVGDRLVLQIDGASHVGAQRSEDIRHDAALKLMGYHVIRVGYRQMIDQWHIVQDLIMRAVAQGLHRAAS